MKKLLIFWFAFLIFIIGPSLVCSVSEAQKKAEEINALLKVEKAELQILRKKTDEAFKKGVFGAPTFLVNNKIFWGQDRLEYAIAEANK